MILHLAGMTLFIYKVEQQTEVESRVIDDVDILEEEERKTFKPKSRRARRKEMAKKFLNLALPTRPPGLRRVRMKTPESRKLMMDVPKLKLNDRKLRKEMKKLDLSKNRAKMVTIDRALKLRDRRAPVALPKLAEVAMKKASPRVLRQVKLAESRQRTMQRLGSVDLRLRQRKALGAGPKIVAKTRTAAKSRLLALLPEKTDAPGYR